MNDAICCGYGILYGHTDGNIKDTPPDNTLDKHPSQTHVQISYHFLQKNVVATSTLGID